MAGIGCQRRYVRRACWTRQSFDAQAGSTAYTQVDDEVQQHEHRAMKHRYAAITGMSEKKTD
jgi:hypothetical protein